MQPIIDAKDLVHEYSRRDEEENVTGINRALDGVSLQVKEGDFIAVLGANGSGKSTFAKHLNALLTPTEGTLYVGGMECGDHTKDLDIRKTVGMVFQNPDNQIISNVVEEDVGFGPENIGVPTDEIWKRMEEALKNVGMYAYRKNSPNKLSGGQKQRVAIAGILAMKPKCIILDESTAMLDPGGRKAVIDTISRINREEKITVIVITHYMEEVTGADYVYVMDSGKVVMEGSPREIFARSRELEEHRLAVPEAVKVAMLLREKGIALPEDILDQKELVDALEKLWI
ncbi:energy-coupling factor transporter ATPase [Clostridium sp. OM07-10AC]|nr:energy-coupling factor transporter ATPase [Clostridium sp. OM07-9AC]RHV06196.1 energy-coupling factor transporter ATPase [Clostridium sp. OM07-10AC]